MQLEDLDGHELEPADRGRAVHQRPAVVLLACSTAGAAVEEDHTEGRLLALDPAVVAGGDSVRSDVAVSGDGLLGHRLGEALPDGV